MNSEPSLAKTNDGATAVLLSDELESLCKAFAVEARARPEIAAVLPERLLHDEALWNMLFDLVENAIHRSGYVIVKDPNST